MKGRVGKTSLLLKYVMNDFDDNEKITTSADSLEKNIEIGDGQ